jgi:hypothetical protein
MLYRDKLILFFSASQNEEFNKNSDCFVLVISSHGEELAEKKLQNMDKNATVWRHSVLGSDNSKVYIDTDVISCLQDDKAKGLTNKPKLFFIQVYFTLKGPLLCKKKNSHSKAFLFWCTFIVTQKLLIGQLPEPYFSFCFLAISTVTVNKNFVYK